MTRRYGKDRSGCKTVSVSVTQDLHRRMRTRAKDTNWSEVFRQAVEDHLGRLPRCDESWSDDPSVRNWLRCVRPPGHDGEHRSACGLSWNDDEEEDRG